MQVHVTRADAGLRLDRFLALLFPQQSRSQINESVYAGFVHVNGVVKKNGYRIKSGEDITLLPAFFDIHNKEIDTLSVERVDFPILYEDDFLLFVNKPPGLVVHPGSGNHSGTLVNGLLYHCAELAHTAGIGDSMRPGIVHRLDKDTSGVMVVAKTAEAHRQLTVMFAEHRLQKIYYAIVCGTPEQGSGRIRSHIGRHPVQRQKMAVLSRGGGRFAATNWSVLQRFRKYALLEVEIETGRTHQIRVHLANDGLPVAGDNIYGGSRGRQHPECFPRQMLHAFRLSLEHPITKKELIMEAPLWCDFQQALAVLRHEVDEDVT